MDPSDKYIETAETDASPTRFPTQQHHHQHVEKPSRHEEIERTITASSSGSSSSSSSDASATERDAISRLPTQRDDIVDLERHPTALSRIHRDKPITNYRPQTSAPNALKKSLNPIHPLHHDVTHHSTPKKSSPFTRRVGRSDDSMRFGTN